MTLKRWICVGLAVCMACAFAACREIAPAVVTEPAATTEPATEVPTEALPGVAVMREFPLGMSEGTLLARLTELEIILFALADGTQRRPLTEGYTLDCAGIRFYFNPQDQLISCEVTGVNYYTDNNLRVGSTKAEVQALYPSMRALPNGEHQETLAIGHLTFNFGTDDRLKTWAWTQSAWDSLPADQFTTTEPPTTTEEPTTTLPTTTELTTTEPTTLSTTLAYTTDAAWRNPYFDPGAGQQFELFRGDPLAPLTLSVTEVDRGADYAIYELQLLSSQPFGIFYVDAEKIVRLAALNQPVEEGEIVCQESDIPDPLGADVPALHSTLSSQGGTVTYRRWDSTTSNGFFETFVWVSGRGLTYYDSGYGDEVEYSVTKL